MVDEANIKALPLTSLPHKSLQLLSCLLNSHKIIPSDGPDKLPRDWRGLASRINISSQMESYIEQAMDKTAKVMAIWIQQSPLATVGELMAHLEYIDRFDVRDDLLQDLRAALLGGICSSRSYNLASSATSGGSALNGVSTAGDTSQITYHDRPGYAHIYDALVLYADEDKGFVDDMLRRMDDAGFQLCTIDDLQVGHATQYAPVARLISERCLRIVLVFSPEFLNSAGMTFYMDYAQAVSIESKQRKIIPIMYRNCTLPRHLSFYHKLFYQSDGRSMYDFWFKLKQSLEVARPFNHQQRRINGTVSQTQTPPQIVVQDNSTETSLPEYDDGIFLPRSDRSISLTDLDSLKEALTIGDSHSVSNISRLSATSDKKKKKNPLRQFFSKKLNFKKNKKALMVAD